MVIISVMVLFSMLQYVCLYILTLKFSSKWPYVLLLGGVRERES